MKTYKSQQIAQSIATRLAKKGTEHKVIEIETGVFAVLTDAEYETHLAATVQGDPLEDQPQVELTGTELSDTLMEDTSQGEFKSEDLDDTSEQVPNFTPAPTQASTAIAKIATVDLPGAYINAKDPRYIFVDNLGGKFRWFLRKDFKSEEAIDGGFRVTLPLKAIKSRGLSHLISQASSPVVTQEQTSEVVNDSQPEVSEQASEDQIAA